VKISHLEEIFGKYGEISKVDLRSNRPKGYAIVHFATAHDAEEAQLCMNGGQLDGRKVKVDLLLLDRQNNRAWSGDGSSNRQRYENGGRRRFKSPRRRRRDPH